MARDALTGFQRAALEIVLTKDSGNPITGKQLAEAIGLPARKSGKEGADIRSIIHALRLKEYPICASGNGYWWPQTQEELSAYIVRLGARVEDQLKAINGLKMSFDKVGVDAGTMASKKTQTFYYEVCDEKRNCKVYRVNGTQLSAFLDKFPLAREM